MCWIFPNCLLCKILVFSFSQIPIYNQVSLHLNLTYTLLIFSLPSLELKISS